MGEVDIISELRFIPQIYYSEVSSYFIYIWRSQNLSKKSRRN